MLTIHKQTVMVHPIIDKFYERDPHHIRSSAFVQAKGLTSNEKTRNDTASPAPVDRHQPELDGYRKMMTGNMHFGPSRSLSPDLSRRSRTPAPLRELTPAPHSAQTSPPSELANKVVPAQGNIKVKRRSIQLLESIYGGENDQMSDTDEPTRADLRNPRKLSQYFPELTLATNGAT